MQPWQVKALELEVSALKHIDGFIRQHPLFFFIGAIYVLLARLALVLSRALQRKLLREKPMHFVAPAIVIRLLGAPPQLTEPFDPFPPLREPPRCDDDSDLELEGAANTNVKATAKEGYAYAKTSPSRPSHRVGSIKNYDLPRIRTQELAANTKLLMPSRVKAEGSGTGVALIAN